MNRSALAAAAVAGTTIAVAVHVALAAAMAAVMGDAVSIGSRLIGVLLDELRWVVAAVLARLVIVRWPGGANQAHVARGPAWQLAGSVFVVAPLVWLVASLLVRAAAITAFGDWAIDGVVFVDASFYSALLVTYTPWILAGLTLRQLAVHA